MVRPRPSMTEPVTTRTLQLAINSLYPYLVTDMRGNCVDCFASEIEAEEYRETAPMGRLMKVTTDEGEKAERETLLGVKDQFVSESGLSNWTRGTTLVPEIRMEDYARAEYYAGDLPPEILASVDWEKVAEDRIGSWPELEWSGYRFFWKA